ncbi:hypothetical protein Tco_0866167 [Tanacetum coccineum]
MASQDARLSKFEADFKQQQNEMTNKIDIVLKAITDRIAGALPSDTVKNPKLSTYLVLSARSYPTEDPQCSTYIHGSINTITIHPKQQNDSRDSMAEEEEQEREGNPEDTNTVEYIKEQRDTPLLERKNITAVGNLGSNKDDEGIEWLDVEEPLALVNTSKESVYELLIKEMPKCSLNYDFRIKKGDPRNLKIPCMIGHKFTANAYIDIDLPMNIMYLAFYNSIIKNGYEYRGIERDRILEAHRLESILQQKISQRGSFHHRWLYLMRKSLEVLRKFHCMILGGRFNQLSYVSSPLLSKLREY